MKGKETIEVRLDVGLHVTGGQARKAMQGGQEVSQGVMSGSFVTGVDCSGWLAGCSSF
jgi:hypothetical protein